MQVEKIIQQNKNKNKHMKYKYNFNEIGFIVHEEEEIYRVTGSTIYPKTSSGKNPSINLNEDEFIMTSRDLTCKGKKPIEIVFDIKNAIDEMRDETIDRIFASREGDSAK